jgi:hypothetical protein
VWHNPIIAIFLVDRKIDDQPSIPVEHATCLQPLIIKSMQMQRWLQGADSSSMNESALSRHACQCRSAGSKGIVQMPLLVLISMEKVVEASVDEILSHVVGVGHSACSISHRSIKAAQT